jgi:chorismate mutase
MIGIRGATTIEIDDEKEIMKNTIDLLKEIISANDLSNDKVTAVFFSSTKDISAAYPAKAARHMGFTDVPLMCFQEMHVEGSLQKCIRLCVFYDGEMAKKDLRHIYLNNAKQLRPDIVHIDIPVISQ